jgi:spore germination cell wall hydrolase CwlJ-like protein
MLHRSLLGMNLLLLSASCVPAAMAGQGAAQPETALVRASAKAPSTALNLATEEPPPPEILAREIAVGDPARPFDVSTGSPQDMRSALECLTSAIYYEARSEAEDGQRAVAQVVLNRVRHPAFPKSVCGVVYQGSNRSTGCQFTFTCDGSLARMREPAAWDRARRIAASALSGYVYSPVGLATHYHTTAIHPWWADSMSRAVTIGSHIFYRWHGEWGDPLAFRRPYMGGEAVTIASADQPILGADGAVQSEFGVTIHRAGSSAPIAATTGIGGSEKGEATEASAGVRIHRSAGLDGIRIHHGESEVAAVIAPAASEANVAAR